MRLVQALSNNMEGTPGAASFHLAGSVPAGTELMRGSAAARGAGRAGLRFWIPHGGLSGGRSAAVLTSPGRLDGGKRCRLQLWVRGEQRGSELVVGVEAARGGGAAAMAPAGLRLQPRWCLHTLQPFTVPAMGEYVVRLSTRTGGQRIDFDDIELYCSP
jgi:hypothetical protein